MFRRVGAREDAQQPCFGWPRHRFETSTHGQRHLGQHHPFFRLGHGRQRRLSADAFGQLHAVADGPEVRARLGQKRGCVFRLRCAQVGLAEEEAKATDAIGGASPLQQRESERDRLVVAAIGDHRLHLEKARLHIVGRARGLGQEELHRLAGLSRDVFEGGQRRERSRGPCRPGPG